MLSWKLVRPRYDYIVRWWHNVGTRDYRRAMRFGMDLCEGLSRTTDGVPTVPADEIDTKLWTLAVAFLWRAYLIDWGGTHPIEADDWPVIAEWAEFDAWEHFGVSTFDSGSTYGDLRWVLADEFESRSLEIFERLGQQRMHKLLGDTARTMAEFTSFMNMRSMVSSIREEETRRVAKIKPAIISASKAINERLLHHPQDLFVLPARRLEEIVAELLGYQGFEVSLTPQTRDGGADIFASRRDETGRSNLYLVEVKRYRRDRKVGVEAVRGLFGALEDHGAAGAMLVTTSSFTLDARLFRLRHGLRLSLKDYRDVLQWLRQYGRR